MHWSLVIRKFLHGAGLWTFHHDKDFHCFAASYMSLVRPICRPVLGIPAKGLDDDLVCSLFGFPTARQLRDIVVAAPSIGLQSCAALHTMLRQSRWLDDVTDAWNRLGITEYQLTADQLFHFLPTDPQETSAGVRLAKCRLRISLKRSRPAALEQARNRHASNSSGRLHFELDVGSAGTLHQCSICGQFCCVGTCSPQATPSWPFGRSWHNGKRFLVPSLWDGVLGTLHRDHLRKNGACLAPNRHPVSRTQPYFALATLVETCGTSTARATLVGNSSAQQDTNAC